MMNNLFSIFDPTSSLKFSLNWSMMMIAFTLLPATYWVFSSPPLSLIKLMLKMLASQLETLLKNKTSMLLISSLFFLIFFNNILGLLAFSFTSTSHLTISLSLALPFWLGFILFSLWNNMTNFLAHLVPLGTPTPLIPFMIMIEITSNIIRPITLSVRLAANMIAGHLLLTLLSNLIPGSPINLFLITLSTQFLLMTLETAVAIIQAYVFSILTTLYASEV